MYVIIYQYIKHLVVFSSIILQKHIINKKLHKIFVKTNAKSKEFSKL